MAMVEDKRIMTAPPSNKAEIVDVGYRFNHLVERLSDCPERLKYDLPKELLHKLWGGKWKGQLQDWFLCRFLGRDSDVNIATEHPEFCDWKWVEAEQLPDMIVPFKRDLYRRLLAEFAGHLA